MNNKSNVISSKERPYTDETGKFKKGNPGRPAGIKGFSIAELVKEIEEVESEKNLKLYKKFAQKAFTNPGVMIALIKKLIPDKTHTEIEGVGDTDIIITTARENFKKKLDDISKRKEEIGKDTDKQNGGTADKAASGIKK